MRTILVSTFIDNFYDAFFEHRLAHNDDPDAVCQNSFLRRGQVNSVLCILLRSSMNLIIHLPRFLDICNCFCFDCIAVGEEECLISFFTFFFLCHQSSFCSGVLISCLILMVDSVSPPCVSHPCSETSRNSSVSMESLSHLNVFGSHEYFSIFTDFKI